MNQKHYMDIQRMQPSFCDGFERGDHIIIQEKIDGANFSIRYDEDDNVIRAYSRKKELNKENDLRGAFGWSQNLNVDLVRSVLGNNLILFAEWLVPHTVKYPQERYNNVYCYDVYDTENEQYFSQDKVKEIVDKLGLIYVPVFYDGEFTSWEDVKEFVGKTELGGEYGEGIVIKNQTKLNNKNLRLPYYTKIVCEEFCETKAQKKYKVLNIDAFAAREFIQEKVSSVVTEARVRKLIHKMVDDGIIPEDWSSRDMSVIAKNLGREVYYDCLEEEPDIVNEIGSLFGKFASGIAMRIAKEILKEKSEI